LHISSYIRNPFLIYDFATDPIRISLSEENFVFFFISACYLLCCCGLLGSCGGGGGGGGEVAGEEDGLVHAGVGCLQVDIEGVAGRHSQRHRVSPVKAKLNNRMVVPWTN
jgi:hypothetical protein